MSGELRALGELPSSRLTEAVGQATVWLLANPVEYHGPHLSLLNDHHCSLGLARALAARLPGPHLYAGELGVGVEPASGPGSRHTPYAEVKAAVLEACRSLVELGARRVVLMTFHGAPMHNHALHAGATWLARRGVAAAAPFALLLDDLVELDDEAVQGAFDTLADPEDRRLAREGLALDFHAGFFETSVAMHLAPGTVDACHVRVPDCPSWPVLGWLERVAGLLPGRLRAELTAVARIAGWTSLRPFPGYTGCPRLANAAAGQVFVDAMVAAFAEEITRSFDTSRPHKPMMGWLRWLTLGGRLEPPRVPLDVFSPAPPASPP